MPINSRTFVKPSIAKAGVQARNQIVLATVVQKVRQIKTKRRVAIVIAAHEVTVQEDQRTAESTIELHDHTPPNVFLGNVEHAAIPTDAGLGMTATERFVTMRLQIFIVNKRQLDGPIVRQVQRAPFGVVELRQSELKLTGFRKDSMILAKSQIAVRIACMSLKEFPAKIEQQVLSRGNASQRLDRRSQGIACKRHGSTVRRRAD